MKKFTKWLALFLAGVLLTTSLAACGGDASSSDDDDDEEQSEKDNGDKDNDKDNNNDNEDDGKFDAYKDLSPTELYEALLNAPNYTLSSEAENTYDGETEKMTYLFEKDGDLLKMEVEGQGTMYIDFKEKVGYAKNFEDEWSVLEDAPEYETFLNRATGMNASDLLNDDYYDSKDGKYTMTADAFAEISGEDAEGSATIEVDGTTYTIKLEGRADGMGSIYEIKIEFKSTSVKLPAEVNNGNNNGNTEQPDNNGNNGNNNGNTEQPDNNGNTDELYSPEDIYNKLVRSENAFVVLETHEDTPDDYIVTQYHIMRDGNHVELYTYEDSEEWGTYTDVAYFDLDTDLYYYEMDGEWYYDEFGQDFEWEDIIQMMLGANVDYWYEVVLVDDNYNKNGDRYVMKADVLEELMGGADVAEGYATQEEYRYTFTLRSEYVDATVTETLIFEFGEYDLELPDAREEDPFEGDWEEGDGTVTAPELSPSEVYDELLVSDNVQVAVYIYHIHENGENWLEYQAMKDGDLAEYYSYESITENDEEDAYMVDEIYELGSENGYSYSEENGWEEMEVEPLDWEMIVDYLFTTGGEDFWTEVMLNDRYFEYDEESGTYIMTEEALMILYDSDADAEGCMMQDEDGLYMIYAVAEYESELYMVEIDVVFGDVDVEIPA